MAILIILMTMIMTITNDNATTTTTNNNNDDDNNNDNHIDNHNHNHSHNHHHQQHNTYNDNFCSWFRESLRTPGWHPNVRGLEPRPSGQIPRLQKRCRRTASFDQWPVKWRISSRARLRSTPSVFVFFGTLGSVRLGLLLRRARERARGRGWPRRSVRYRFRLLCLSGPLGTAQFTCYKILGDIWNKQVRWVQGVEPRR